MSDDDIYQYGDTAVEEKPEQIPVEELHNAKAPIEEAIVAEQPMTAEALVVEPPVIDKAVYETSDTEGREIKSFNSEHLEILNDVVIDIIVEIGRTKMKITELLNLKKGAVIELAQSADEPLQIFANDKLIAKGVIVSANGRYCVKII